MILRSLMSLVVTAGLLACATPQTVSQKEAPAQAVPQKQPAALPTGFISRPLETPPPLQTVLLPTPNKPIVSLRWMFRTGSVDDPSGKEGLTALTVAMLEQGGTRSLSSSALIDALFPIAGELYAHTDKEFTTFVGRIHRDNLDPFLKIMTDVLLEPRWAPAEFTRLKSNALNEIKNTLRNESDEELGKVALDSLLFAKRPYAHFTGGTVKALESITLDDVKAHWKKVFTQDRLMIGLAGAVDPALEKTVLSRLSALPPTGAVRPSLPAPELTGGRALLIQKDALSTAISFGYVWDLRRGDPDYFSVAAALSYLGEHRQIHNLLFGELREKRGLNYGDYAYVEHFEQEPGTTYAVNNRARSQQDFSIWIRPVEPHNAVFATRGALYFLQQVLTEGVDPAQFDIARGFLIGYTRLWEATDQRRLGYAMDELVYGTPHFLESFRQALKTMTVDQVNAALRKHLQLERLNFAFVAPNAQELAKALVNPLTSPIQYPTAKPNEVLEADKSISTFAIPIDRDRIQIMPVDQFMEQ